MFLLLFDFYPIGFGERIKCPEKSAVSKAALFQFIIYR